MKIKRAFTKLKKISEMPLNITMTGINQMMRFYYHSSASLKEDNIELVCRELRILTHTIEKGMALPRIRKGFGKEKIKKILELMDKYISIQNSEYDQEAFDYAYAILEKYIDNAAENECDISFIDLNKYQNYKKNQIEYCGTEIFDSQKLLSQIDSMNFEEFAKNRHSVRDFAVGTVDESIIRKAVELAQTAPSACNRQSTRVHYIQNRDICKNVLDLQGGAKGHLVNGGKSCMAGFVLKNTLSDNGGVTRGICKMDAENNLTEVVETKNIVKTAAGAEVDGKVIDVNSLVSMNMWGLTSDFLDALEEGFKEFFEKEVPSNPLKAEYLIPIFIGELLEQGKMSVKVLKTNDTWYGMTYHEDVAAVKGSFKEMLENGVYKADLFSDL